MKKRLLSILLMCCMVLTLLPTAAFAEESTETPPVCTCETACTVDNMNKECPVCGAENAIPQNCGQYIPVEDRTGENGSTERADDPNGPTELSAANQVQAMIDGLPNAEEITEDNAEEVKAQLDAIDEAKEKLSDEEIDELDMTRYAEAAAALGALAAPMLLANDSPDEQFTLTPGGTYYFDLSGASIPGTVNGNLPDSTLHYVPFTYAGTVDAYKLTTAMETTEEYAQNNKYAHSLFVADYAVTHTVSWDDLNTKGLIFGKNYASGGVDYTMRAPSAGSQSNNNNGKDDSSTRGIPKSNEWDAILDKANQDWKDNTSGYIKNWSRKYSFGQDNHADASIRAVRGHGSARYWRSYYASSSLLFVGFRPVLEILNADTLDSDGLKVVTLDLNGGKLGGSSDAIHIIVKNGSKFTAPASNGLTRPAGNTGSYFMWLGSDGKLYAPGANVPAEVTKLTAQFALSEQFSLAPGGRYYFDLSTMNIPGTANSNLPDSTLHYVPFTYVGTVDAYKLMSEMATTEEYARQNKYAHSLFVADYAVTHTVSWNDLNTAGLIFGKNYASGGVDYTLRAPSVGSNSTGSGEPQRGTPQSNEWDRILDKDSGYIKNWNGMESWGQDTRKDSESVRVHRGFTSARYSNASIGTYSDSSFGFRPVLELPTGLAADSLKVVALGTAGHMPGETYNSINIIVKKGESFKAPSAEGLPLSDDISADTPMWWVDENGNFYKPGDTVPADVSMLSAFYGGLGLFLDRGDGEVEVTPDNYTDIFGDGTASFVLPKGKTLTSLEESYNLTSKDILEIYSTGKTEKYGSVFPNLKLKNADLTSVRLSEKYIGRENPLFITLDGKNTIGSLNRISMSRNTLSVLGDGSLTLNSALTLSQYTQYGGSSVTMTDGLTAYYLSIDSGSLTVTGDPQAITLRDQDISDLYMGDGMRLFTGSSAQDAAEAVIPQLSAEMQEVYQRYLAEDNTLTNEEFTALSNALKERFNAIFRQLPGKTYVRITGAWDVTYKPGENGNGNAVTDIKFYNDALTLRGKMFTRTGYTQVGWATVDGGEKVYGLDAVYTQNEALTLYPVWQTDTYAITYDLNGGTAEGNPDTYTVETDAFTLKNPTRPGYIFTGWSGTGLTGDNNLTVTIPKGSTGNRSYTAHWSLNTYSITYDLNGGTASGNPTSYTVESATITLNQPTKTGYTFTGWSGTDLTGEDNLTVTIPAGSTGDRSYTAHWSLNTYSITYDLDGGTASGNPDFYTVESSTITLNPPTRTGYTFIGWSGTDLSGSDNLTVTIPTGSIGNRSYTAHWSLNTYSITYDLDGGTAFGNPDSYTVESAAITLNEPAKAGYVFTGWSGTDLVGEDNLTVTIPAGSIGDRRYTAHWEFDPTIIAALNPTPNVDFLDVSRTDWFYYDVRYVCENGLMNGTSRNRFSPYGTATRGMLVTILYRMENEPRCFGSAAFSDVKPGAYYEKAVVWASQNNIVSGYTDGTFRPDAPVTREQLASILYRYTLYRGQDVSAGETTSLTGYGDAQAVSSYALPAMRWACGTGILQGANGKLNPSGLATRAQLAAMLHRYLTK